MRLVKENVHLKALAVHNLASSWDDPEGYTWRQNARWRSASCTNVHYHQSNMQPNKKSHCLK